jgi:hypothetical protein
MSDDKNTYVVHRSEFSRLKDWAIEAIGNDADFGWFVMQFQSCFGRSAAYNPKNPVETFEGFFMRYQKIADKMTEAGYEVSLPTIKRYMPRMAEIGIVSKAKVTPHPRSKIIYVLNYEAPFENDWLAEKIAARERAESPYATQAVNAAKKKEREATGESREIIAARDVARVLTEDNTTKNFIIKYLTEESDATVQGAAKAVLDFQNYSGKKTYPAFLAGTKSFDIHLNREQEEAISQMRDHLNRARQMDRQPAESYVQPQTIITAPTPTPSPRFKTTEQLKAEEKLRRQDIEAEKARQDQIRFEQVFAELDI